MNIAMNFLVVIACVFQFYQFPSCNSFTQQLCFIILVEIPLVKPWPPVLYFTLITTSFTCFSPSLACWSVSTLFVFHQLFPHNTFNSCNRQDVGNKLVL